MEKERKNRSVMYLAQKYMKSRSKFVVGKSHYFTITGICLGVCALLCVSSVMNGFRNDIKSRIMGTLSEIRLQSHDTAPITDYNSVIKKLQNKGYSASGVVRTELLIKYGSVSVPAVCFGIDPYQHQAVSTILKNQQSNNPKDGIIAGALNPSNFNAGEVILGAGLASQLGVYIGDTIQLVSPVFNIPTAFGLLPKVYSLNVAGIFSAGMPEYDQSFSFVPLSVAQFFNGYEDVVDYIEIRSSHPDRSKHNMLSLTRELPDYRFDDWSSFDSSLYTAIQFEKFLMFVIILFMFIIASFNLTGSLLKMISQKKRELGLLKALGYKEEELRNLFLWNGIILSSIGIVGGVVIGSLLLWFQHRFGLIQLPINGGESIILPVKLSVADYLSVIIVSYVLTFISVILPLKRLKEINAVELIRRTV